MNPSTRNTLIIWTTFTTTLHYTFGHSEKYTPETILQTFGTTK